MAAFAFAACSGGDGEEAPDDGADGSVTGVGSDFAAQAVQVCGDALADKAGWAPFPVANFDPLDPDPSAFPEVAGWLEDEVAPTFDMWLTGLQALGAPPSAEDAWADILAAVEQIGVLNDDQIAAAGSGDTEAFAAATQALRTTQVDLVAATDAAGVPECAEVHA